MNAENAERSDVAVEAGANTPQLPLLLVGQVYDPKYIRLFVIGIFFSRPDDINLFRFVSDVASTAVYTLVVGLVLDINPHRSMLEVPDATGCTRYVVSAGIIAASSITAFPDATMRAQNAILSGRAKLNLDLRYVKSGSRITCPTLGVKKYLQSVVTVVQLTL